MITIPEWESECLSNNNRKHLLLGPYEVFSPKYHALLPRDSHIFLFKDQFVLHGEKISVIAYVIDNKLFPEWIGFYIVIVLKK